MHFWLEIEMSFNFNYYDEMNFLKEIRFLCAIVLLRNSGILPVVRYISIVQWYDFMPQMDGMILRFNPKPLYSAILLAQYDFLT